MLQRLNTKRIVSSFNKILPIRMYTNYGVVLDIDGVLVRGKVAIDGAKETIEELMKNEIPFVILTNGGKNVVLNEKYGMMIIDILLMMMLIIGGLLESNKTKELNDKLNVKIHSDQMVLCHTPMKELVQKHKKDRILVIGKHYNSVEAVMNQYGFEHVVTIEQYHALQPLLFPDMKPKDNVLHSFHHSDHERPFGAIFILMDPYYWGRGILITI